VVEPAIGDANARKSAALRLRGHSVGVWSVGLRRQPDHIVADAASELDSLGFDAVWIPGSFGGEVFDRAERILRATSRAVVATGVVNIWMHDADEVARRTVELAAGHEHRFLLGLGCSHAALVARAGLAYSAPVAKMEQFLDDLDADGRVDRNDRVLAALGPRMLDVAARRAVGVHPFNVTPMHTAMARSALGPDAVLAPELKVVLADDPSAARRLARAQLSIHLQLPNYVRNLKRLGFGDDDIGGGGSDRLVDGLVAWGDEGSVRRRIDEHFDAGADHVCLNVLTDGIDDVPLEAWRRLAAILPERNSRR